MSIRGRLANVYRAIQTRGTPDQGRGSVVANPLPLAAELDIHADRYAGFAADMPPSRPTRSRVMIVDDHALVRDAVRRALDGSGIDMVGEAATAEEALERASELRPDLILLDIDLPAASGLDVIAELRRRLPSARIVMLTVSSDDEDVAHAIRLGASGFLTKDMGSDALRAAVQGALSGDLAMSRRMAQRLIDRMGSGTLAPASPAASELLTMRELEILRLLADGMTAREIGEALVLSPRTVEGHVGKILRKLGARNRVEAVQRYRQSAG